MEIRDYLEKNGDRINVLAVNWMEDYFGPGKGQLDRVLAGLHPAIRAVKGTPAAGALFGGIQSVPASLIFDAKGHEVFRTGGKKGRIGRDRLHGADLARIVEGLR